ncbi:YaeQ family protein [Photobacterium sanguinicancri]|uniref:YaeQ family protein n=1 Tax=Photobacterium sanguinicancri TaxID=875932 RepID=A0AAW7Y7H2_9GAMM|nr:YaeQ family protein [Photobacterium sanguinicancri]MDO6542704.1 YaeQ family protein [Photobacterium sanguinicancri]OZS42941.1 hypothetical protein ASV53_15865 [Photobacterium sanguinicancri]
MALKATIYKAQYNVADLDRHVYLDVNHTVAQHPSETEQRLMLRLLAWGLKASEDLVFTKGLSDVDEPELWNKNYSDEIELWVDLGLPDEKRIKKSCNKAKQVLLVVYGDNATAKWWQQHQQKLSVYKNLEIIQIKDESLAEMEALLERSMQLQLTIESEQAWLSAGKGSCEISPIWLKRAN